jgi:hypothetical protein
VVKTASHFKRSQNTRPRKFLARLVDANEEDEPMLVKAYLMELLEEPGDYITYWEDALCCSVDVQLTFEPYDPYVDEVELPSEDLIDNEDQA